MKSDKYVTIGIKATKDVRKALDMLQKELPGGINLRSLFENMLYVHGKANMLLHQRMGGFILGELLDVEKDILRIFGEIGCGDSKDKQNIISGELEIAMQLKSKLVELHKTSKELADFYSVFLSIAFPEGTWKN